MVQNEPQVTTPTRITIGVSLPIEIYDKLRLAAAIEKRSLSNKVRQVVADYFERT